MWRDTLRYSARKEFELNRGCCDSYEIYQLMINARDSMQQSKEMLVKQKIEFNLKVAQSLEKR